MNVGELTLRKNCLITRGKKKDCLIIYWLIMTVTQDRSPSGVHQLLDIFQFQ